MRQDYPTPASSLELCYEIKKSRFIARCAGAENRQQAMNIVAQEKQNYPDARHHCWAYVLGDGLNAGCNDDGEPSGTAGKPMLNVLNHADMSDVVVVISRYFGGIKLGAGGLVRAYSTATQQVIDAMPTQIRVETITLQLVCDYALEPDLRHWLDQHQGQINTADYQQQVRLEISLAQAVHSDLIDYCAGKKGIQIKQPVLR